jgi:hypothetical protein
MLCIQICSAFGVKIIVLSTDSGFFSGFLGWLAQAPGIDRIRNELDAALHRPTQKA